MQIRFSDQQMAAITAPLEPAVIVAGAGSGKTTVMAARVVWLVGSGQIEPHQVLGLTFTNKAAKELLDRVRGALTTAGLLHAPGHHFAADCGQPAPESACRQPASRNSGGSVGHAQAGTDDDEELGEPTVLTYHAYAARLLTEHGLRIGHEPDTRVIADASRFQLAARAVRMHEDPIEHLSTWLATSVTGLLALDAQLSEHLVEPQVLREFQAAEAAQWRRARQTVEVGKVLDAMEKRRELLGFVETYRRVKADLGVMDFADQMRLAAELVNRRPEVGVCERDRFRVVLLDEYQDTSVAQARLLTGLFSGSTASDGRGHPVTAVGDPCQGIYGWRGAAVSNIDDFPRDFPLAVDGREPVRFPLSINRRSQRRILSTANTLATPLFAAHPGSRPLEPAAEARDGTVRTAILHTYADELDFLARDVPRVHQTMPRPTWSEIGVLVRDNKTAADVHDALVRAGVPVEVVGLSGLLRLPEVVEVVATLEVLHDVTANAALLTLLSGPRWAIGPRDLALLGQRARQLAQVEQPETDGIAAVLEVAVAGTDPTDVVSLVEALDDPGPGLYSTAARQRFALLSAELRSLRRHVGEPLLDLVRRVVDHTGLDVELASSVSPVAEARRNNLATFLDAVATFAGVDGDASLQGLLAYLAAEEEYAAGLELALPTDSDSVKLLTVHRAKGLEWDVVFVPGMGEKVFPNRRGRGRWPTSMQTLPSPLRGDAADLPPVTERSNQGLAAFVAASKEQELMEERRLGYVAVTRPRQQLVVSCHWWGPEQKEPRGPSEFMQSIVAAAKEHWGTTPEVDTPPPEPGEVNPANRMLQRHVWPTDAGQDEIARRRAAAELVSAAAATGWQESAATAHDRLLLDEQAAVEQWDREIERLLDEARSSRAEEVVVPMPAALSATTLMRLPTDPDGLARDLARPMPRRPSPTARFGTRFHAWVEAHVGQQLLLDPDELPGRADLDITGDDELRELIEAFRAGPFGDRPCHQVEAPFALVLGGHVIRGRIDAVYTTDDGGFLVVDWKTNKEQSADPLQLAVYRVAWAEVCGVPLDKVSAGFCYVRTGDLVTYDDLPNRADLEALISGRA
jgi:DNA helicase-2/ATP-dependent DNA helicase PcrA